MLGKIEKVWRNRNMLPDLFHFSRPTFSQFGEDLAIANLLRPKRSGTYVDVGANHPFEGSNTAYFYMLGWSGLAIDPNPKFADAYRRKRPRDIYLTCGASSTECELTYYEFPYDKFNTLSAERADQLAAEGEPPIRQQQIPCRPLGRLLGEHMAGRRVDLLNVDCEGFDLEVLQSADLAAMAPTVVIIEDFDRYRAFRDGRGESELDGYMRRAGYSPVYQCAWTSIYIANGWREAGDALAFDPPRSLIEYMPQG
ncbi:MAG: FkbM family methyltransferase [Caulobacteraceae bacterium]